MPKSTFGIFSYNNRVEQLICACTKLRVRREYMLNFVEHITGRTINLCLHKIKGEMRIYA